MIHPDELFFNVTKGPGKFDLMASLFDGKMSTPRNVEFHLEGAKKPIAVAITMVQQEDGSGESWNISGSGVHSRIRFNLRGHLSTTSRQGYIKFEVPSHQVLNGSEYIEIIQLTGELALLELLTQLRGRVVPMMR